MASLRDKNLVLGITGGIAAYKSAELLRLMKKAGARVRVIMTANACRFIGPMTLEALSENPVCTDLFHNAGDDASIRHIAWARDAAAVVIAPATANIIGKFAGGLADDALSTFILAVTAPVLVCPAMNTHMYEHPAVQENLRRIEGFGHRIVTPGAGELACGTTGPGRMAEPPQILDRLRAALTPKDYAGIRVLVTAGPTREFLDPARFISNPSSGKMGYAVAGAAERRGARVVLISGPVSLRPPENVKTVPVTTAEEMAEAVLAHAENVDLIVKTAAVADYRPRDRAEHKIKKGAGAGGRTLALEKTVDILKVLGERKRDQVLVGFAAETRQLAEHAAEKMARKNLDMIVGNLVGNPSSGFGSDTNQVTFFFQDGAQEALPVMEKDGVADALLDRIRIRWTALGNSA